MGDYSMKKTCALLCGFLMLGGVASADLLVAFDFAAYTGAEIQGTSTVTAVGIDSPSLILRGSGISASANGGRFNAQGWDGATSAADALTANNYFEWTVAAAAGYSMSITQIAFQVQRSNTGASNLVLRTSVDSYVADLNTLSNFAGNNATVASSFNSSSIVAMQNVEGSVTFRVIGWPGATTGSMGFEGTGNDIEIFGTATLVPEPGTLALMATGLLALTASRRKIRQAA
jgi:hypothetical protein